MSPDRTGPKTARKIELKRKILVSDRSSMTREPKTEPRPSEQERNAFEQNENEDHGSASGKMKIHGKTETCRQICESFNPNPD
jgi:hypothetical protein